MHVAVVGAGPAGLYSAADLVRRSDAVVDIIDRVPAPYGLVRYGVAPDHPRIKGVVKNLQRILERDRVRFIGNVEFGRDIDRAFLNTYYDATIYATGALHSKPLGIEGEHLSGSCSASNFVSWYNGHPDAKDRFVLEEPAAAVVGAGNVALDVARILTQSVGSLTLTDIPPSVLESIATSRIRDVHVVCRRGAAEAKFTTKELLDLRDLRDVGVVVDPADLEDIRVEDLDRAALANIELFQAWAADRAAQQGERKRIHFRFWARPEAITGSGRVQALRIERTEVADDTLRGTGDFYTLPVGMVLSSVGYRSTPLPGLPFEPERGILPNIAGRVVNEHGHHIPSLYVTGWLKRGPHGVIGTNRTDAAETVTAVLEDLTDPTTRTDVANGTDAVGDRLRGLGVEVVDYDGWQRIDDQEQRRGQELGRDRVKITEWAELRAIGVGRPVAETRRSR
ncbi:FAD-dependent oxidoreductase [Sciscionella marina]|uniref:FAD-dependent oxidoreductase n=1 Tax=Sciscionella marina TaxID=508770 RepID=UPI00036E9E2F|nr:FAD-dependent oxidoreductase [Sciscionella marina]